MHNLLRKLNDLGIELILADIEKRGYYLPVAKILMASNTLDKRELKKVILHELKHIISHTEYIELYKVSFTMRSKMEHEANVYMIEELISESDGFYNYSEVVDSCGLSMGDEAMFRMM